MTKRLSSSTIAVALLCAALPAWSQELPEGKGKEIITAKCGSCHAFHARVGSGYTAEGWTHRSADDDQSRRSPSKDEIATITPYLAKNFPEKSKPAGVVIPGPAKVSMKTWQASTPGRGRTTRWRRRTDHSGTRARWPMCSAG